MRKGGVNCTAVDLMLYQRKYCKGEADAKKRGPMTEPWGTPEVTEEGWDVSD